VISVVLFRVVPGLGCLSEAFNLEFDHDLDQVNVQL
jgi:hypothetical protein